MRSFRQVDMALALLLLGNGGSDATLAGNESCPCVNVQHAPTMSLNCTMIRRKSGEFNCYPLDYGSSCKSWDADLDPECKSGRPDPPSFCLKHWCYINETTCRSSMKSMAKSAWFPNLTLSYETCNSTDTWSQYRIETGLQGKTLRASMMDVWYPYGFGYDENGAIPKDWSSPNGETIVGKKLGLVPEFLEKVAESAGFNIEYMSISASARKQHGGWTGCLKDIRDGNLDICAQIMYITPERSKYAVFTIPYQMDRAYMVIPTPTFDNSLIKDMFKVFEPFSPSLWALVIGVSCFVGSLYRFLGPASTKRSAEDELDKESSFCHKAASYLRGAASSFYVGIFELISGGPLHDPLEQTPARRSLLLGWQMFLLIFATAYLANLAAYLSKQEVEVPFANVGDCITGSCNFCTTKHAATNQQLDLNYPKLNLVQKKGWNERAYWKDFVKNEEEREGPNCDASWSYSFAGHDMQQWYNVKERCGVNVVGEPLFTLPVAFPTNEEFAAPLNHHIQKALDQGVWKDLLEKYAPNEACGDLHLDTEALSDAEADDKQLTPSHFLGITMVLLVFVIISIKLRFGDELHAMRGRTMKAVTTRLSVRHDIITSKDGTHDDSNARDSDAVVPTGSNGQQPVPPQEDRTQEQQIQDENIVAKQVYIGTQISEESCLKSGGSTSV